MNEKLLAIEKTHHVKILFACEAGSRAWGLSSEQSDYDVRFIYVHPLNWYLDIDQKRDVIEQSVTRSLDLSGWDLRKALFLLRKSNPPLLEWLQSEITYLEYGTFRLELEKLTKKAYSPKACIFHYLNMAKRNAKNLLQKEEMKVKQLFTVLRPLLVCKWIEEKESFPTMIFPLLATEIIQDQNLKHEIDELIRLKKMDQEYVAVKNVSLVNQYIHLELAHLEEYAKSLPTEKKKITEELNQFFRKTLKDVWG